MGLWEGVGRGTCPVGRFFFCSARSRFTEQWTAEEGTRHATQPMLEEGTATQPMLSLWMTRSFDHCPKALALNTFEFSQIHPPNRPPQPRLSNESQSQLLHRNRRRR